MANHTLLRSIPNDYTNISNVYLAHILDLVQKVLILMDKCLANISEQK